MTPEQCRELEQAQEGSRELDGKIWCLKEGHEFLGICDGSNLREIPGFMRYRHKDGDTTGVGVPSNQHSEIMYHSMYPNYTTNLQDALGLVPEGWGYICMERYSDGWYVRLKRMSADHEHVMACQKPAALALTIASLKAIKEKAGD